MLIFGFVIFSTLLNNTFSQKRNKDIKLVKDQTLLCEELSAYSSQIPQIGTEIMRSPRKKIS